MTLPIVKNNEKESATFEEALEIVGTGYFQIKVAIIGGIVILSSYFAVGVMTFVLPAAHCDLHLSYHDRGNLASISFVGLIISCHMWGFLSDTLGRRYILIRCLFFDALLYFVTMMTPNFYIIFFVRLLNGVASCGGVVSIYAYISEFQIDKFRSTALMISSFIAASAYTFIPLLAWIIVPGKWQFELYSGLTIKSWRLFYVACGLPSLISAILLYFLPESPKFLMAKGKNEKVIEILRRMYKENHKKEFTIKHIKMSDTERVGRLDDNKHKFLAVFHLLWNQTGPLLKKPYRFNFMLLCVALFVCYFCNNGMYVWLPEAINRMKLYRNNTGRDEGTFCEVIGCGNPHSCNKNTLKTNLSNTETTTYHVTRNLLNIEEPICNDDIDTSVYLVYILFGIVTLIVWVVIAATIRYFNKKYVMLLLVICNLLATMSMKWSNALILMPIKACSIMVFIAGIFPILNSIVVDIFPTNLRAMASCLTLMASRLGTVFTHEVTGFLIESHCKILMWNYIILSAICLLTIVLLPSSSPKLSTSPSSTSDDNEQESRQTEEVVYL